jgi:hypothetical protein
MSKSRTDAQQERSDRASLVAEASARPGFAAVPPPKELEEEASSSASQLLAASRAEFDKARRIPGPGEPLSFNQREKRKRELGQTSREKNYVEEEKRVLRHFETGGGDDDDGGDGDGRSGERRGRRERGDVDVTSARRPADKQRGERERQKRERGQSSISSWKSEAHMIMRQSYD